MIRLNGTSDLCILFWYNLTANLIIVPLNFFNNLFIITNFFLDYVILILNRTV